MPSDKKARESLRTMRATGAAAVEGMEKNAQGAEAARIDIQSSLGAAGSYDLPNGLGLGQGSPTSANVDGLIKSEKAKSFWATQGISQGNVQTLNTIDPEAVSNRVKGSAEFRIRSRMTAEAEQLLAREGALYDRMIKNQVTPVAEALGAASREALKERKQMLAKGGSARRQAFAMEQQLREKENLASKKATEMSNIYTRTDEFARKYAESTLTGNKEWVNNLGGVRDDYVRLANSAHEIMLNSALPNMMKAEEANHKMRAQAHAAKREKGMAVIKGIAAVVMMATGAGGMAAGMLGAMGGAAGAATGAALDTGLIQGGLSMLSQTGGPVGEAAGIAGGLYEGYQGAKASQQQATNRLPGPSNNNDIRTR